MRIGVYSYAMRWVELWRPMDSLFTVQPTSGTDYEHVWRRVHEVDGARQRIDDMWHSMRPLLDSQFAHEFRTRPYERSWELILGSSLLAHGAQLVAKTAQGPDFKVIDGDRFVWIEATAPTSGGGPDAIPVPPADAMFDYPERQIILRIRGAIEEKLKQFQSFAAVGGTGRDDAYVIAVNGMQFHTIIDGDTAPAVLKAVLPIGAPQIRINGVTGEVVDNSVEYRPARLRHSGSEVATTCFLDPAYSSVSAVLFSEANFLMGPEWVSQCTTVVHNPRATQPLPSGWFGFGREIFIHIDDDSVSWTVTSHDGEASGEQAHQPVCQQVD